MTIHHHHPHGLATLVTLCMLVGCEPERSDREHGAAEASTSAGDDASQPRIYGGTEVLPGERSAVVTVTRTKPDGDSVFCSGTLITDVAVATAAHCMCDSEDASDCVARATVSFHDVHRVDDPTTAFDESIGLNSSVPIMGDSYVYPYFETEFNGTLRDDVALVYLDQPAYEVVQGVTPIEVESTYPDAGDSVTLIGYGRTNDDCSNGTGNKRKATVSLDSVSGTELWIDSSVHICPGDSGGAILDVNGRLVGVISYHYDDLIGTLESVAMAAADHVTWLAYNGCPAFDPDHPQLNDQCKNPLCPCDKGAADCDSDDECKAPYECALNVGADYGLPASVDVCECPEFDLSRPSVSFCTQQCPCDFGEGDCDHKSQCISGLVCGSNNGAAFGLPSSWETCVAPAPGEDPYCGDLRPDSGEACDDGNNSGGDGCSPSCQVEPGWQCPEFFSCYPDGIDPF